MIEEGGALSNNLHTRLYSSALTGDWAAVDQLLAQGADPAWTHTKEGQTVVHVAALQGNVDALLKFHGISERYVSLRDAFGETPLHKAAGEGKLSVVMFLCEKARVDPKVRNSTLQTPADLAVEAGYNETAEWINNFITEKQKSKKDSLWNISDLLHRQLYEAVMKEDIEEMLRFISNGADACWNHGSENQNGKTAIHVAAEKGNLNILTILLDGKATRATLRDSSGETPLHKAAAEGKLEVCRFLVEHMHSDPAVRNATLQTPADLAIESDQNQVADYLSLWSAQYKEANSR